MKYFFVILSSMTQLHEHEALQIKARKTIEPAQGKEKKRLEVECEEYLEDSERVNVADFLKFTENMIQLIGGKRRKSETSEVIFTSSDPLLDQEAQASIVFEVKKSDLPKITVITIKAQFADRLEQLLTTYSNLPSFHVMSMENSETLPKLDSYITGKKEPVSLDIERNHLEPNEAKDFVRRVFDVYTRQEQQVQDPTPQN